MSNKKQTKKELILQVYFNKKNKKKGYEVYKKSELKNMWLEMSKGARLYGYNRTANNYAIGGINKNYLKCILDEKDDIYTKPEHVYVNGILSLKRSKSGIILESSDIKVNILRI